MVHLVKLGVLDALLGLSELFLSFTKLSLHLLDLLLERHDQESLSLVALSSLHNRSQCTAVGRLLCILNELVLL